MVVRRNGKILLNKDGSYKNVQPHEVKASTASAEAFIVVIQEVLPEEFPSPLANKEKVPCTYQDVDFVGRNVHMADKGTCRVPKEYTITLQEWRQQQ